MSLQQAYARFAVKEAERTFWHMVGAVLTVGFLLGYFAAWMLS